MAIVTYVTFAVSGVLPLSAFFPDDKHHIQTVPYWSRWMLVCKKCGIRQARPSSISYRSFFLKGLDKTGVGEDYQANPPPGQFNHLFAVYLPIIFIPPTTERNMFGRFEKKRIGNGVEWAGRYVILDTTPALICEEWRKPLKTSVRAVFASVVFQTQILINT